MKPIFKLDDKIYSPLLGSKLTVLKVYIVKGIIKYHVRMIEGTIIELRESHLKENNYVVSNRKITNRY
jgi:hypothetical protein